MNSNLFPAVILAGGLATRLRPLTETIPKSLVDVKGEPFIVHQLRLLKSRGIKRVIVCLGHLGEHVVNVLSTQSLGVELFFSFDGDTLLGTGGAVKHALNTLKNEIGNHFFVLYGDSYLTCDYEAVQKTFEKTGKKALMTVFHNRDQGDRSNVEFSDGNIVVYDKKNITPAMHHIDYGLGVFHSSAFDEIERGASYDLSDLYQRLLKQNELAAHEVFDRFYEVGSFSGINDFETFLAENTHAVY